MKIAIVSDTHDNIKNFSKVIDYLNKEKIHLILHCGDICNKDLIDEAIKNFNGSASIKVSADKEIKFVKGNSDFELDLPETMELELGSKKIFFNHYPDIAKRQAESQKYDLVFYGHTHKPWEEKIKNCRLVNPGELAGQRFGSAGLKQNQV